MLLGMLAMGDMACNLRLQLESETMVTGDFRKLYRDAWNRLFEVVKLRNQRLRRLDTMAAPAMSVTMATTMIFEFDTDLARQLLVEIDELTPRINAGMEEVNGYAAKTGAPTVQWRSMPGDWGR